MTESWLKVIAQEMLKVPGLLSQVYGDLASPGVKQVGMALDTILGLGNTVLLPAKMVNEKSRLIFERNMERFRTKMENVAEDKVIAVAPEIGVPIVDKLTYVTNDQLAELYAALLATASNTETVKHAHPRLIHIIDSLSPDDGKFLGNFAYTSTMPIVLVRAVSKNSKQFMKIGSPLVSEVYTNELMYPENTGLYISNLEGLGLITRYDQDSLSGDPMYKTIEEQHHKKHAQRILEKLPGRTISYQRGAIELSPLGTQFLEACSPKRTV